MKINKLIFIFIALILSGCSFQGREITADKTKTVKASPSPVILPIESVTPANSLTDMVMAYFKQISGITGKPTAKPFLYNTQNGEKTINGEGFALSSADFTLETLREINTAMRIYLRDMDFETDMYNAMSGTPGYRVDRLKLHDTCCQLRLIEDMENDEANLDFSCGKLVDGTENQQAQMSLKEAISIAETSVCVETGTLDTSEVMYNENSKTWWIDLLVDDNEGCNPACVVSEDKTAEINWRCTGFIKE